MTCFVILTLIIFVASSSQCVRNESGSKGRMIGQDAVDGQFPYAVLFETFRGNFWMQCGGAFIWPEWIISSAKCVDGMVYGIVYLGSSMLRIGDVAYIVYPPKVQINSNWDTETGFGDLALIRIPKTDICGNIFPVPLPAMNMAQVTFEGRKGIASEWIADVLKLQWLRVTIMTKQECYRAYLFATDSVICAYVGPSQCSAGDYGGPLISEDLGVLIGIRSNSIHYKGACIMIYTRITSYLAWINGVASVPY